MQNPFMVLTVYSIATFVVPIGVFFGTQYIVETVSPSRDANVWGAVTSVVSLHIVLFMFVWKAFQEEKKVEKETAPKRD